LIKPIKILKKPTGSVQFWFFKPGTGKTELNRTEPEPNKTEPNRVKTEPNGKNLAKPKKPSQTGLNQFLLYKTKPNRNRSV
jgi:hypothetical protein